MARHRAAGFLPPDVVAELDNGDLIGPPKAKWDVALRRGLVSQADYDRARQAFPGGRWYTGG